MLEKDFSMQCIFIKKCVDKSGNQNKADIEHMI